MIFNPLFFPRIDQLPAEMEGEVLHWDFCSFCSSEQELHLWVCPYSAMKNIAVSTLADKNSSLPHNSWIVNANVVNHGKSPSEKVEQKQKKGKGNEILF